MTLEVDSIKAGDEVILTDFRLFGVNMMLGMNSIKLLGVSISRFGKVKFGSSYCGTANLNKERKGDKDRSQQIEIKKKDHEEVFDGIEWRVISKWRDGQGPDRLCYKVAQYMIPKCAKADYENELQDWINRKWLPEYNNSEMGPPKSYILLMAVIQQTKTTMSEMF